MIDLNDAPTATQTDPLAWEVRKETLRAALKARAEGLVREVFPAAYIHGGEARIGDVSGAQGESMAIELRGERAGLWTDHATGQGGDLIDLWGLLQGYPSTPQGLGQAIEDLELHLGLRQGVKWTGPVARVASERAKAPKAPEPTKTLEATYVYTSADGQTVLAQVLRFAKSDGGKTFRQKDATGAWKAPDVRPLYRLPRVVGSDTVVLVEGEKCVEALEAIGAVATTAMGGASAPLDKTDWRPMAGRRVVIWPDNDEPGLKYASAVQTHLQGLGCRVSLVSIPPGSPKGWDAADAAPDGAARLISEAVDRLPVEAPAPKARGLRFLSLDDLEDMRPPEWLIQGLVPAHSLTAIIAPPASYKSFLAIDWALSVAYGRPWLDRFDVRQGDVVYVAGEGQYGIAPRVKGWRKAKGLSDRSAPLHVVPQAVAMPTGELDELLALIATLPRAPVLIVLDTVARCFGSGDENSTKDMSAFIAACDHLKTETGTCVMPVHHTGKDVEKGARGSSALPGACDAIVALKREERRLTVINSASRGGKQKDGPEHDDIALVAETAHVEMAGIEATTLVLIPDETPPEERQSAPRERPSAVRPNDEKVLSVLRLAAEMERPPMGFITIQGSTQMNRGTLSAVLKRLVEEGQVEVLQDNEKSAWRLKCN